MAQPMIGGVHNVGHARKARTWWTTAQRAAE
jgi:hypothetical protein